MLAPIALFVYKRPDHTKKALEALKNNALAQESDIYIFSDGWKNNDEKNQVQKVRNYVKNISGFRKIEIIEREVNFGLAKSIISGVTDIVNKYGKIIVLEDDLVTSPYFLQYMNDSLDLYKDEKKVISIHGYMYPTRWSPSSSEPETLFLKNPSCWGWGTWKRGWDLFEHNGEKLLKDIENGKLKKQFDFENSYDYYGMLKRQVEGKNNSWAIRWYASAFLKDKLTLYPTKSLVENVGFDGSGVHSNKTNFYKPSMASGPIKVIKVEVKENKTARQEVTKYFRSLKPNILKRIYRRIKNLIPVKTKMQILNFLPNIQKKMRVIVGRVKGINIITPDPKIPNFYMFKNHFNKNSTIVDVGCGFDADFSIYMIGKHGVKAIGIDPTLKHQESLHRLSQKTDGKFSHKLWAISAKDGKITFNESEKNVSGSILKEHKNVKEGDVKSYEVESVSLSTLPERLGLTKIEYLKLDIEGAEYDLIEQFKKEDLAKYDQIFVEFHHHAIPQYFKKDTCQRAARMESFGFKSFTIDNHNYLFYK